MTVVSNDPALTSATVSNYKDTHQLASSLSDMSKIRVYTLTLVFTMEVT